jgi:hypothetical protein
MRFEAWKKGIRHQGTRTEEIEAQKMKLQKSNHPVWDSGLSDFFIIDRV